MLKRILLCTTHHSAPTTTKSFTHAPLKKHSIDRAFLALAVMILLCLSAFAQQNSTTAEYSLTLIVDMNKAPEGDNPYFFEPGPLPVVDPAFSDDLNMVLNQANSGNVGQDSASGDSGSGTGSSAPERDEPGQSIFGPTGDLAEKAIQFGIDQVANLIGNVVGPHFNLPC